MIPNNIQLLLRSKSITIRIEMFSGVLTERTFTGINCYLELLHFLKQIDLTNKLQVEIDID